MTLPTSRKIVVIDDCYKEVAGLLSSLSKNGVSFIYFTEKLDQLPDSPLAGIRVVFSDIDLVSGAKDDNTKISALIGVLKKIISPDNGPYIIVFWTKHSELIDSIKKQWDKKGVPPLKYLCIEKSSCKDEHGDFSIDLIDKAIQDQTKEFQAFNFYLDWENILTQTGENFIAKFHELIPPDTDWSRCVYYFLFKMYKAVVGKKVDKHSDPEKFIIACQLFNKSFNNELDHAILDLSKNHRLIQNTQDCIDQTRMISSINRFLWIHKINTGGISSGDVFFENNSRIKSGIVEKILKESDRKDRRVKLAKIIITPPCDIAQNKLIGNASLGDLHRVVYAIIAPCDIKPKCDSELWYYEFGPFVLGNNNVLMHFHFGTVGFEYIADRTKNPNFSIKQEIVFDIQSKIANHMNRLGNSLLK